MWETLYGSILIKIWSGEQDLYLRYLTISHKFVKMNNRYQRQVEAKNV